MDQIRTVVVPDIGDFKDVPVIEVLVKVGDAVQAEDSLVTLESDKATIDIPSPYRGVVKEILVKAGDKLSEGVAILRIAVSDAVQSEASETTVVEKPVAPQVSAPIAPAAAAAPTASIVPASSLSPIAVSAKAYASPSIRRFARELGVNLDLVTGSGLKHRIRKEDVQAYVKNELSKTKGGGVGGALNLLPWPQVDFAKFGPIELKSLTRVRQISGANLHRNWVMIPHVTQFDEADITDLEALRKESNEHAKDNRAKLTLLAFLMKALIAPLKKFPEFNASLDNTVGGELSLIVKHYYHIGFAVDTAIGYL